ncbi:response regulator [Schlesneria sp. T3-172]|uniref:response regulator n=1 Tax=Schlesneria sphaerica TaxID=3373610 RepID=UPI0037C64938
MNYAKILHLEDSSIDAEFVRARLEQASLVIVLDQVSDRKSYLAKLQSQSYDLILSDYQVPMFDGLAALEIAKVHLPNVPFIFVSGAMGEETAVEALRHGATDYVLKDRLARLPAAIERALAEAKEKSERQKAEARARSILESMNESFLVLDTDWRITYVNVAFERMNCVGREEVLDQDFWKYFPGKLGTSAEIEYRRVMSDGVSVEFENHDAESNRWFDVKAYRSPEGGICVQAREVTERKQAELAYEETKRRFRLALQGSRMGTWDVDLNTGVMTCSDTCKFNYGRSRLDSFTYSDLTESVHQDDLLRWQAIVNEAITNGSDFEVEYRVNWPDLSIHWVNVRGACIRDRSGTVTALSGLSIDITERKEIEESLRASERRVAEDAAALARLNEASSQLWRRPSLAEGLEQVLDATIDLLGANMGNIRLLEGGSLRMVAQRGFRPDVLDPFEEMTAIDGSAFGQTLLARVIEDIETDPLYESLRPMARSAGYRAVYNTPIIGRGGETLGIISTHFSAPHKPDEQDLRRLDLYVRQSADFIEHYRAEMALRTSEERFRALVTATSDVVFRMSPDWTEMLQLNSGEFMGQPNQTSRTWLDDHLPPDDQALVLATVKDAIQAKTVFQLEHRFIQSDGKISWVFSRAIPVLDAGGKIAEWFGMASDVTRRKLAEATLEQLLVDEKRRAALLERVATASRSVNAVLSAESIARILTEEARDILEATLAVTTFTTSEGCQQDIQSAAVDRSGTTVSNDEPAIDRALAANVCKQNQPIRIPRRSDEPLRWGRLAAPLIGHGGKNLGVIQVAGKYESDFTSADEAVLAQLATIAAVGLENARLYEQLREQDRRKDEFLATLAHELRNPLAPVRNGLQILRFSNDETTTAPIKQMIERQVAHMVRLIDDLLDVSRITRDKVDLKKELVNLREIFNSALEVSHPLIQAGRHEIIVAHAKETLLLDADPTRLAQVVTNLLNNAAKYTPEGGRIELTAEREGREAVIRVRDNGVGIPREMLPKVFEIFTQVGRTLDRSQGGLGIGLALVNRLIDMHGGSITATSEGLGHGSTFVVRLPLAMNVPESQEGDQSELPPVERSLPLRILVVDDNFDSAASLAMLLKLNGHTTQTAHNGPDALAVAESSRPQVVFLDIGLPGMNGYEVAHRLRSNTALGKLFLVALTGWGTEDDRRIAKESGFDHHFTKPVEMTAIVDLLRELGRRA